MIWSVLLRCCLEVRVGGQTVLFWGAVLEAGDPKRRLRFGDDVVVDMGRLVPTLSLHEDGSL